MSRILLIEPGYRNKYPPLGLMKISSYHKLRGDYVLFAKGCIPALRQEKWDRVYVSTLFTFHWKTTIDTIKYYGRAVDAPKKIVVGGVMATLLVDEVRTETGATVITGLLNQIGVLDPGDKTNIDVLPPDYSILKDIDYCYGVNDAYIGYATRGCPNKCGFCAVQRIEPTFSDYLPLKRQVQAIETLYGARKNLVLLDNNVLASKEFERIISDIQSLGFERGATFNGKLRYVDFNQGIDPRLLTPEKMKLLASIALKPLRLAFDHIELKEKYVACIRQAVECGITSLSNYVLYNYKDTPQDFYERLRINVELNQELKTHIYSFPMKYIPLDAKDRSYIGPHWNRQLLRGVQCILLATMGKVGTNMDFFNAAFGQTAEEFTEIAMMPEDYIINRKKYRRNQAAKWHKAFRSLTPTDRAEFMAQISRRKDSDETVDAKYLSLAKHYGVGG